MIEHVNEIRFTCETNKSYMTFRLGKDQRLTITLVIYKPKSVYEIGMKLTSEEAKKAKSWIDSVIV